MNVPDALRYSSDHEWARLEEDGVVRIGITDYAQDALGPVVFAELPAIGQSFTAGESLGEVESTKSVSDVFSPISGRVEAVNEELSETPELLNEDPYGEGWLVKIRPEDVSQLDDLLDAAAYRELIAG